MSVRYRGAAGLGRAQCRDQSSAASGARTRRIPRRPSLMRGSSAGRRLAVDRRTTRHPELCRQPAHPERRRGGLRLHKELRRPSRNQVPSSPRVRFAFTVVAAALPDPTAEAHRRVTVRPGTVLTPGGTGRKQGSRAVQRLFQQPFRAIGTGRERGCARCLFAGDCCRTGFCHPVEQVQRSLSPLRNRIIRLQEVAWR